MHRFIHKHIPFTIGKFYKDYNRLQIIASLLPVVNPKSICKSGKNPLKRNLCRGNTVFPKENTVTIMGKYDYKDSFQGAEKEISLARQERFLYNKGCGIICHKYCVASFSRSDSRRN